MTAPPLGRPAPPPLSPMPEVNREAAAQGVQPVAADAPAAPGAASGDSATNVQEAGVDEPDVVKAGDKALFVVSGGALLAVDARSAQPRLLASLPLTGWSHQLLLHEGRLLVLSQVGSSPIASMAQEPARPLPSTVGVPALYQGTTRMTEVDVRDPAAPRVVRTQDVEGAYVTARLHDGAARVVIASSPEAFLAPSPAAERSAGDWIPQTVVASPRGAGRPRLLTRCDDVARPRSFSGLSTVTLLTVDMTQGLPAVDADAIVSDAHTVYASTESVYVATQAIGAPVPASEQAPPPASTAVHRFDTSERRSASYRSSGTITGTLLNQFSLSERRGVLRAATTEWPSWWPGEPPSESQSVLTTLVERDGRLERAGRVDGLGRGERIYAVRFLDDVGYVVTFRQTGSAVHDRSLRPGEAARARRAEDQRLLAYLHPVGDDLLLGIGQDATDEGRRIGAQVSLFDVRDLRSPRRLAQVGLGDFSFSPVEGDHHAFLHWPATGLAVVPVMGGWSGRRPPGFSGRGRPARLARRGLVEAGRAAHEVREYPSRCSARSSWAAARDDLRRRPRGRPARHAGRAGVPRLPASEPPPSGPTEPQPAASRSLGREQPRGRW
jgi:hypothetical protein